MPISDNTKHTKWRISTGPQFISGAGKEKKICEELSVTVLAEQDLKPHQR